jgi:hypothetical protein
MFVINGLLCLCCLGAAAGAEPEEETSLNAIDLPDFSRAGYHGGRRELPKPAPTVNVKDFGAAGDGATDDTKAIQAALEKAAESSGVVEIPAGRWVLTDVLRITTSGVALCGAGSDKTTLVCPKSLTQIIKPDRNWSWSGGMVWVRPAKAPSKKVAEIVEAAPAGSVRLRVKTVEGESLTTGAWYLLQWYNDTGKDTLLDRLYGGVIPHGRMGSELRKSRSARVREWVRIDGIDGDTVTIQQAIRIDARPEWRPTLTQRSYITEVGVEGLTFEFAKTAYPGHLREKGYNGVYVNGAINCWVRDIRTVNADSGIFVNGSRYCTVQGVRIKGRKMHHCISMSWSSDCLFTGWRIEAPHVHGTTISWCAHGNVYSDGWARGLAMDSHRAASFENLHTDIVIEEGSPRTVRPFRSGGSGPRGPHSARRNVYWNIAYRFAKAEGPPVSVRGHDQWPLGVFVGWHGNRPLVFRPIKGMRQQVLDLNEKPAIENLHLHQRDASRRHADSE